MEWISPEDRLILSEIEGRNIEKIKIIIEGSENYEISKVSGDFPQGIELIKEDDGFYYIQGKLGYVPETMTYYFTLQATDLDTGEESEHWYSIEVITLNTTWCGIVYECLTNNINERPDIASDNIWKEYNGIINDELQEEDIPEWEENKQYSTNDLVIYNNNEIIEKTYFQKQFKLKNPEGNEVFKKVAGELPEGIVLSETGLLYGVAEEDREKPFYFRIGVYRNDELLIETSELFIKVKDISELNKPLWITDAGILDYINYGIEKDLQVIAYDFSGHDVYYELISKDLPTDIQWRTIEEYSGKYDDDVSEKTGKFYGKCKTKVTNNEWFITLKPYIIIDDSKIYGDERTFNIVTNAVEDNDLIKWETDELEPVKIGYSYRIFIKATSSSRIIFELSFSELPKGLTLNKNGEISGTVDYQELKDYEFYIKAYTSKAFSVKKFILRVEQGFSKNSANVFLYINKEYQEEYQDMLIPFDRTSAYNSSNELYKIPSSPKIMVGTLNTYDNVLLKYKMEQFNTPIEIFMKEIKKKTLDDYDLFYKNFNEVNKTSETYDLKLHEEYDSENDTKPETIMKNKYNRDFIPGYLREFYYEDEVDVVFNVDGKIYSINDIDPKTGAIIDPQTGKELEGEYIIRVYEERSDKIVWYYSNLNTKTGKEVVPEYIPTRNTYDYAFFGNSYVYLNNDINDKVYVREVPKDTYYEIESKRIIKRSEEIYIDIQTLLTGEEVVRKYIIDENGNEFNVDILDEPTYVSYDPYNELDTNEYIVDSTLFNEIYIEENKNNYYTFNSPTINFQTSSIDGIRKILNEKINVEKLEETVLYKVGNQEIVNLDDVRYVYDITTNEDGSYTATYNNLDDETRDEVFYVYAKIDENTYKKVFAKVGNNYEPLIQKEFLLDENPDYVYYTFYKKGSNIPFNNALFRFDDGRKIYVNNNEWFLLNEIENPYVYYAENNSLYGYDKDIVLPYIQDEHVENGVVQFLDIDKEKDYLPDYMVDTSYSKWQPNTNYLENDEIVYNGDIYKCKENHVSKDNFDISKWEKIGSAKRYEPILPLYFAIHRSHDTVLKNINAKEKEGNYWYGRKFIFYEIHFEPKYRNANTFTIDFYNHVNENSPEFQLI